MFINEPKLWLSDFPKLDSESNKYTRGHAVIYGGYPMTGAARLAATACARVGSGLTTVIVPEIAFPIYAAALTSVMVHPVIKPEDFDKALHNKRPTAFLIGPGAGISEDLKGHVLSILATKQPTVIDASAIKIFQNKPFILDNAITGPCILTPHEGEFRYLFKADGNRVNNAYEAAKRSGAIIVLKGHKTVIAAPDGRVTVNDNAPFTLATAGSGDVLSGIISGLLAQGMEPFFAAAAAVWIHGEAANIFGPGLIAEDLVDMLPKVLQKLLTFKK